MSMTAQVGKSGFRLDENSRGLGKYDKTSSSTCRTTTLLKGRDQQIQVMDLVDVNCESLSDGSSLILLQGGLRRILGRGI